MSSELILPIYIDTNVLLDLLASIEGGFAVMEKVSSRTIESSGGKKSGSVEAGTEFGVPNVLSLLKITIGGMMTSTQDQKTDQQTQSERYHTYGSLLYRLRAHLEYEKLIKRPDDSQESWEAIHPSDFVEVRGVFRPNPLAHAFGIMERLLGLYKLFAPGTTGAQGGKKGAHHDAQQITQISKFLESTTHDLQQGDVRIFVVDLNRPPDHRAVVSLFSEYLRDPTLTEIAHKEYYVLGKVVRRLGKDEESAIDLLRGTAMGGIGKEAMMQLTQSLGQLQGMNLPAVETEIRGPAIEIVPIAIFI